MNPYLRYQQQALSHGTRIDSLLAIFDAACQRTEQTLDAVSRSDPEAGALRVRARLIVLGLWAGVHNDGSQMAANLIALYQFVVNALATGGPDYIRDALGVLYTLREGFQGIQDESRQLERTGLIPPNDGISISHGIG